MSTLLSIKTGARPEDCAYCPQSVRFDTGVANEACLPSRRSSARARAAREAGATRSAWAPRWRSPKPKDLKKVAAMVREVSALGLETCVTLGMVSGEQARELKEAGLDYYNHNLDTSEEYLARDHHHRAATGSPRHPDGDPRTPASTFAGGGNRPAWANRSATAPSC